MDVRLPGTKVVEAAGGVVWRRSPEGAVEVLLVHRPRYDDWTVPKGKLESDEDHAEAALREVAEETGLRCTLGPELVETSYRDRRGRPKRVRYWAMEAIGGQFTPSDEVDDVRWLGIDLARARLTYSRDQPVLDSLGTAV